MDRPPRPVPAVTAIPDAPLYDARWEHDACGVGFVAETGRTRRRSTRVVPLALEALASLTHRGAIAADARTGDGAGLAVPLAPGLVSLLASDAGVAVPDVARLAVGAVFLPPEAAAGAAAQRILGDALADEGLMVLGWRQVPVDPSVLGPEAAATAPDIRHVLVARPAGMGPAGFDRALLLARRTAEAAAAEAGLEGFHVASLSRRTLVYKGLFVGGELGRFYADLGRGSVRVPYAVFHQRYSTNTHPSWALAQPFRLVAHNGEINTVRGNREAMRGRSARLGGGALGGRLGALTRAGRPLLDPEGRIRTSLDESLELLIAAGWPIDAAVMALLPEALDLRDETVPGLAAWQASALARVEPWDGPAALVFSDGRRVGCVLDRNGLRPAAFEVRRDGLVVCGSEAGMLPVDAGEVVRRGRLGPGELLARRHGGGSDPGGWGGEARARLPPRRPARRRGCSSPCGAETPAGEVGHGRRRGPPAPGPVRPRRRAAPDDHEGDGDAAAASRPGAWATTRLSRSWRAVRAASPATCGRRSRR